MSSFVPPAPLRTPVLLAAFSRYDTARQVMEAIRVARPPRLYFACDGPRNAEEKVRTDKVRSLVELVDWPCELHTRFRDHTLRIFEKHGMTNIVYLAPMDAPASENQLVYLLAHKSRDAAKASWSAFANDPEWKKVASESQVNGRIVEKVDSVFLTATDYSPLK